MLEDILSEYLQQPVKYNPDIGYISEDGSIWEIVKYKDPIYEYEIDSYSEELFDQLCEELKYTEFQGITSYINWDEYFKLHYSLENFGWEYFRYGGEDYFILEQ
jgi:hypothetical protein